jgi:hypothetical protein
MKKIADTAMLDQVAGALFNGRNATLEENVSRAK